MNKRFPWLFAALALLLATPGFSQTSDLVFLQSGKRVKIPFSLVNNFIVINVMLDDILPVRFIVDTGAENTVLLEKTMGDMLNVDYRRSYSVQGADLETILQAFLATGIDMRLDNALLARQRSMLVLAENYFNFEHIVGEKIHGILGADFLMRFVLEIDYKKRLLVLHEPARYRPSRKHEKVEATFARNRPYLELPVKINATLPTQRRLLLDTGAGLSLLLHTFGDSTQTATDLPVQTVPTYIADGLGGQVAGTVGRARQVQIADKELTGIVTYFQPVDTIAASFFGDREGIIGNRILKRFNVVIDYVRDQVYLRPQGRWRKKFRFDRSGMSLLAGGKRLSRFSIASIIPDSPADRAGLRVGDHIVSFNGIRTSFMGLDAMLRKLEGRPGRKIKLKFVRSGQHHTAEFRLEELI